MLLTCPCVVQWHSRMDDRARSSVTHASYMMQAFFGSAAICHGCRDVSSTGWYEICATQSLAPCRLKRTVWIIPRALGLANWHSFLPKGT